jgi:hypothetical protein
LFGLDLDTTLGQRDRRGAAFFLLDLEILALDSEGITVRSGRTISRVYKRGPGAASGPCDPIGT